MTWWDENDMMSIYPGVSLIYTPCHSFYLCLPCISIHPPSLLNDVLEALINQVSIWTSGPKSRELWDSVLGRDRASLEMHLETDIEWTQICTCRPWSSKFIDTIGDWDLVHSEMHCEAVIGWVWICTWRRRFSKLTEAHRGCDRESCEMQLSTDIMRPQR